MGCNVSILPQLPVDFPYFCIRFQAFDKIKIINANQNTLKIVQNVIASTWPEGIHSERVDNGVYEIKLVGNPFRAEVMTFTKSKSYDAMIAGNRMCCQLLATLKQNGWTPCITSDLTRSGVDRTTWFFERLPTKVDKVSPTNVICLSIRSLKRLQLINAPEYMGPLLKDAVGSVFSRGIANWGIVKNQDYEIELNGWTWQSTVFKVEVEAKKALLQAIRAFDAQRYRLFATVNLKGTGDSLFFEQDPNITPGETRYMMLSLNCSDRIRMIDAPHDVIEIVRQCIVQHWGLGLQEQSDHIAALNCFEFKLRGYPWNCSGHEAIASRLLITAIMQALLARGWAVLAALDVSRQFYVKPVLVFRSCLPTSLPHFCLSPSGTDKIRLINAPQDIVDIAISVIRANWPYGIQKEGSDSGCYEFKLKGLPWDSIGGNDYAVARHLLCLLLKEFALRGWRVICSADVASDYVQSKYGNILDVQSWFLAQTGVPSANQ